MEAAAIAPVSTSWHAVQVVRPPAVLDMEAAASLKAQLVRAIGDRKRLAILDMSEVEHLDALPLVVIVHAQRTAGDTDSRLVLTGLGGQPREMFDEWAPVPPIEVYPTVQEAVAQLSA